MKKALIVLLFLFSGLSFAQSHVTATISAGDSLSVPIKLTYNQLLQSAYTLDSLYNIGGTVDTTKLLEFYFYSDTTGYYTKGTTIGLRLTAADDASTLYSAKFLSKRILPLTDTIFQTLVSSPYDPLYLQVYIPLALKYTTHIVLKTQK